MLVLRSKTPPDQIICRDGRLTRLLGRPGIRVAKSEQLGLFDGGVRNPGSKGGKFHLTESGKVRYGEAAAAHPSPGALGDHVAKPPFKLDPPEIGQTKSGKPIPHPHDTQARYGSGTYSANDEARFGRYSESDHADAATVHGIYAQHHRRHANTASGDHHEGLARVHEAARDSHLSAELGKRGEAHAAKLPAGVRDFVSRHVRGLHDLHDRNLFSPKRLGPRYEAEAHLNAHVAERASEHGKHLDEFRRHAPANGVDAEAVIHHLGGGKPLPDTTPSPEAKKWLDDFARSKG